MLRHIIMFKLRPCDTELEKDLLLAQLKEKLEQLPSLIPQIKQFEIGLNVRNVPWAYDIVIHSVFHSMDDLEIYQEHPAHQEFIRFNADKSVAKTAVDYYF